MGAFDSIEAEAQCPECGDIHYLQGTQTKFFEPDYHEQRWMRAGEAHPLAQLPAREHSEWWRVRDPIDEDRFTLLVDADEMFECSCDCACAPLLHFVRTVGEITLVRVEVLDARRPIAHLVDFTDCGVAWGGNWESHREALRALEQRPAAERAATLHAFLAGRFEIDDRGHAPWTVLIGPTRCEACNETRERILHTMLTGSGQGSFFGAAWAGGAIYIGDRMPFEDLGYARCQVLRPTTDDSLAVLGARSWSGCKCGAGPARYVARFERRDAALVLVELALRAIDDTRDINYAET